MYLGQFRRINGCSFCLGVRHVCRPNACNYVPTFYSQIAAQCLWVWRTEESCRVISGLRRRTTTITDLTERVSTWLTLTAERVDGWRSIATKSSGYKSTAGRWASSKVSLHREGEQLIIGYPATISLSVLMGASLKLIQLVDESR